MVCAYKYYVKQIRLSTEPIAVASGYKFALGSENPLATASGSVYSLNRRAVAGIDGGYQLLPIGIDAALQNSDTAIPAQDRVVISMRPDRFGFFKVGERVFEQRRDGVRQASGFELGLRLALVKNSGVI